MRAFVMTFGCGLFLTLTGVGCGGGSSETKNPSDITAEEEAAAEAAMQAAEDAERAQYQN